MHLNVVIALCEECGSLPLLHVSTDMDGKRQQALKRYCGSVYRRPDCAHNARPTFLCPFQSRRGRSLEGELPTHVRFIP